MWASDSIPGHEHGHRHASVSQCYAICPLGLLDCIHSDWPTFVLIDYPGLHTQDHVTEKARLLTAGCNLAQLGFHLQGPAKPKEPGVGPLRIWPGGLCVSRSIGDVDAGPEIVPLPHIKQV